MSFYFRKIQRIKEKDSLTAQDGNKFRIGYDTFEIYLININSLNSFFAFRKHKRVPGVGDRVSFVCLFACFVIIPLYSSLPLPGMHPTQYYCLVIQFY